MNDYSRLREYINKEFDYKDIYCCMLDKEKEIILGENEGIYSNFEGFGKCKLYEVYYDIDYSIIYNVWVNNENIIAEITI